MLYKHRLFVLGLGRVARLNDSEVVHASSKNLAPRVQELKNFHRTPFSGLHVYSTGLPDTTTVIKHKNVGSGWISLT